MTFLQELRHRTQPYHQQAETLALFKKMVNQTILLTEYRHLLQKFWGFWRPLEQAFQAFAHTDVYFNYLAKLPLLKHDLLALGMELYAIEALPSCQVLPPLNSSAAFLGCLYVMEGSMLGGQVLTKLLHKTLALSSTNGIAYFYGQGDKTLQQWRLFCAHLEKNAPLNEQADIIQTAIITFTCFQQWMESA